MAIIQTGPIVSDIRGSIGETTFSRNLAGLYAKAKWHPATWSSDAQIKSQTGFGNCAEAWNSVLNESERQAWRDYAADHPLPGRFGHLRTSTGYHAFLRHNIAWAYWQTYPFLILPPTRAPLPMPAPAATLDYTTDTMTVALPCQPFDPPEELSALYAYASRPQAQGTCNSHGPWRAIGMNQYNTAWGTDPWAIVLPWDVARFDVVWLAVRAQSVTYGSISNRGLLRVTAP